MSFPPVPPRTRLALGCPLLLLLACSNVYDAALLTASTCGNGRLDPSEACDTGLAPEKAGACPDSCPSSPSRCAPNVLAGSGCQQRCVVQPITRPQHGDSCCPAGATHDEDDDCAICGDGVVGAGETCDPPERCLTERSCVAPDPCVLATLRGAPSSCDTRCELTPMTTCQSGDGCCPTQCAQDRDGDCSATCGDGEVDPRSETCDLSSETQPCSEVDCDDGEACTLDLPTGSAQNCNVSCTHTTITDPADDDGCCPRGATAQSDTDCTPSCGNGRLEPGEDCDGEPDCSERCTLPGPLRCRDELARYDGISDDCIACTCARCEARVAGCHDRTDPADGVACSAVLSCAREHECDAAACYCGLDRGCAPVDGPCREELEDAAGSRIPAQVLGCLNNASCPAARAFALQTCMQFNCAEVCAP